MYLVPTNNINVSNNHLALLQQQQFQQEYLFAQQQQQQQSLLQQQQQQQEQEQASTRLHFPVSPSFSPVSPLASPNSTSTLPSLLVPSPPNSPMTSPFGTGNIPPTTTVPTLGKPNRACASCKKRKVKCDRKTPSCTACQKSKLRCFYTSYSPSTFIDKQTTMASSLQQQQHHDLSEERQDDDVDDEEEEEEEEKEKEEMATLMIMFKAMQDRIERIEKTCTELKQFQQQYYLNNQYPYLLSDDDTALLRLNLANPKAPLTRSTTIPKTPLRNSASTSPSQAPPPPLALRNSIRGSQSPTSIGDSLIPNQHPHGFNPYPQHSPQKSVFNNSTVSVLSAQQVTLLPIKRAIITFNYKSSGLRQLLGHEAVPMLSTTTGPGPQIPVDGFQDLYQMQSWFGMKIQALLGVVENFGNILDPDEKFQIRPLSVSSHHRQQFEIVLCRVVRQSEAVQSLTPSLPGLYNEEMDGPFEYEREEEAEMNTKSSITPNIFASNNTNPSRQLIDNSDDIFLTKVYALIRFFISHLPWVQGATINEINCWNEGLFSDVIVEIVSNSTSSPSIAAAPSSLDNRVNVVRRERFLL